MQRLAAGPVTHLRLAGVIDETFNPQQLTKDMVGHTIVDVGRVERISSFGVRKWIELTSKLPEQVSSLYVIHAPPLVVDQLNMVEGFAGVARVLSVLAPYTCARCKEDRLRLVDVRADAQSIADGNAPDHVCPVCQSRLEFADQPNEFFDYLRHQQQGPVNAAVNRYLQTLKPSAHVQLVSHVKLIKDDITFIRVSSALRGDLNTRRLSAGLEGRVAYDLGNVNTLEPEAVPKLEQIFDDTAENAQVFLWRVPPIVLSALSAKNRGYRIGLLTLLLPCDCRNCGNKTSQRVLAATYAQEFDRGGELTTQCQICGGTASVPALRDSMDFIRAHATRNPQFEDELEALEPRALSQYLAGSGAQDGDSKSDTSNPANTSGAPKLQILRRLGQGGMAEVFLARQVGLKGFEKYVVVKKILENLAQSPDFVEMLFAEARANARLTHPNIVQTYDVGMMDGAAYITMEYVRGPDVKKLLMMMRRAGVQLPIEHALRIVAETAAGLHYAHSYVDPTGTSHPVVHRDVSPHNILVSLDGAIKLSDFGIAKIQGESENTRPGTFKGKIAYVSPETIACQPLDARNDVFSLGVVLFELLTGTLPFRRESEAAVLRAIMQEPPPNPSQLNPAIPPDVSAIILRALEKSPSRRVQTAGQLREELEAAMARNNFQSSPGSVARFFQEKLKDALSDFGPSTLNPSTSGSVPAVSVPSVPEPEVESDFTEIHIDSGPSEAAATPARAPAALSPALPFDLPSEVNDAQRPKRAPVRQDPPSTEPKTVAAAPLAISSQRRRPEPTTPAPPPAAARRTAPKPRSGLGSISRGPYLKSIISGISVGALAAIVAALALRRPSTERLEVRNLPADEQLYVMGVRVDPESVRAEGDVPLMVATARGGKLHRYGQTDPSEGIDVQFLIETNGSTLDNQRGALKVRSQPAGCEVQLGNEKLPKATPMESAIPAGKELLLTVSCPAGPAWQRWILAIPGQTIDVEAKGTAR